MLRLSVAVESNRGGYSSLGLPRLVCCDRSVKRSAPDEQAGLPVELDARLGNSRSLHCAHPDSRVRSGRDDNSFVTFTFPIKRNADPSAALPMNKK
jgi:hypothetical protein